MTSGENGALLRTLSAAFVEDETIAASIGGIVYPNDDREVVIRLTLASK
jgi:hypothetical protein